MKKRKKSKNYNDDMEWAIFGLIQENERLRNTLKYYQVTIAGLNEVLRTYYRPIKNKPRKKP